MSKPQLKEHKRKISFYCSILENTITKFKTESPESISGGDDEGHTLSNELNRLSRAVSDIEAEIQRIEQIYEDYTNELYKIAEIPQKEEEDWDIYANKKYETVHKAEQYTRLLKVRIETLIEPKDARASHINERRDVQPIPRTSRQLELPTLPIPTFTGDIWEWDNFWEIFKINIHLTDLSGAQKLNYLRCALKGDALNSIKKFQITNENYEKAIELLKNKYCNPEKLIGRLVENLESCSLSSVAVKDQRELLEQLQTIISQLTEKGENVDGHWLTKRVLSKFPEDTKFKVLEKKQTTAPNDPLRMQLLLQLLDEVITNKEVILLYSEDDQSSLKSTYARRDRKHSGFQGAPNCMYCKQNHKSFDCSRYKTPQQRNQYLRDNKLCAICASNQHTASQCKKRSCFNCQGRHHTSCCMQSTGTSNSLQHVRKVERNHRNVPHGNKPATTQINRETAVDHVSVGQVPSWRDETAILEVQRGEVKDDSQVTVLPIGKITVMNTITQNRQTVPILLDTGAELSFIDNKLARELNLPVIEETKLHISTFGSTNVKHAKSSKVSLNAWDAEGQPISMRLFTHDNLTKTYLIPQVPKEDISFLLQRNLPVDLTRSKRDLKPAILLGADQLWSVVKADQPHIELPSGLHLLPTRLGHLITGKARYSQEEQDDETDSEEYPELNYEVNVISQLKFHLDDEDDNKWEKCVALDLEKTDELASSENEIRNLVDQQVWNTFNETIEKRADGYYVRLPWKNTETPLPDNKAIALKRLTNVWNSMRNNRNLLEKYNDIFAEQIRLNILEEVKEETNLRAFRVHYIPHQAVVTPDKNTKIRIVYDASAHYKGCPSLNNLLHRGPVILPELFGILLRFRVGRIAIVSDIEKAFLQVRLHEADRDVTRCLWLHDHRLPPTPNNIKILRFTRVTFGLITSPFLLAGTVHFHLEQHKENTLLVKQIKQNMYVDNLILTVDDLEQAQHIYKDIKQIFKEINMNIRQFASNDAGLMTKILNKDKCDEGPVKVLGIPWHPTEDYIQVSCKLKPQAKTTKRTVASTIASVYDPMGWLLPLLHRAKLLLRELWKEGYDWDKSLPGARYDEWTRICADMDGFRKTLPRCLGTQKEQYTLAVFADASNDSIATSVYLRSAHSVNLLIAKNKLASIKSKITIPKMELDAVTLAFRLSNRVLAQLNETLNIEEAFIFTDSEIVINWITNRPLNKVGTRIFNRLMEIGKIVQVIEDKKQRVYLGHVESQYNAADCATRGLSRQELQDHLWWSGPPWLREHPNLWKHKCVSLSIDEDAPRMDDLPFDEECSAQKVLLTTCSPPDKQDSQIFTSLEKYSLSNAKRIIAWIFRYISTLTLRVNSRKSQPIILSPLWRVTNVHHGLYISGEEIAVAGKLLINHHQLSHITASMLTCMKHLNIKPDAEGLLRCIGRLGHSDMGNNAKNPLIVIQNSWLAQAIIDDCHRRGHPGTAHTMAIVRQNFWIPKLRAQVTRTLRRCWQCQKFNNTPYRYPEQGDLPELRVRRARPFEHVGLDYFGPLTIIKSDGTEDKCYGCIITCTTTRLINLDIASDLSTTAFIMILRRFFARRGMPKTIISDNAPTFVLGETIINESLREIQNNPEVQRQISNREIQWKHITPFAPWQGGFYERLIKSVKHSLYKTIGTTKLSFEHLLTIISEIEALLNTRPLLYMESQDGQILRPIYFLQNEFEVCPPLDNQETDVSDHTYLSLGEEAALKTKQQVVEALQSSCKLTERFWRIWKTQYLTSLREKHQFNQNRKKCSQRVPKKGDIVQINDPIQPRHSWKIGRISELVSNSEGAKREAIVLLPSHRKIRRPVNLLVPLELEDTQTQDENESIELQETEKEDRRMMPYNLRPRNSL